MALTYIILSANPANPVMSDDENNTFYVDYTINIGVQGDSFGLSLGDGTRITWSKAISGNDAELYIQQQVFEYVNNKYNNPNPA